MHKRKCKDSQYNRIKQKILFVLFKGCQITVIAKPIIECFYIDQKLEVIYEFHVRLVEINVRLVSSFNLSLRKIP